MNEQDIVNEVTNKVKEILEQLGVAAEIKADLTGSGSEEDERNYINLDITGEELGMLIGYQGNNLQSLERVLDLMLAKLLKENKVETRYKILIDVNGYKLKKEKLLKESTLRAIEQAKESGQNIELSAMTPAERRIVHLTVQEEKGVTSVSEGEEGDRRVVIKPSDK